MPPTRPLLWEGAMPPTKLLSRARPAPTVASHGCLVAGAMPPLPVGGGHAPDPQP